jgi:Tol biopolymer transport system component
MTITRLSAFLLMATSLGSTAGAAESIETLLARTPHKLLCEGYANNNWELFIMNADGAKLQNLTNTADSHEVYPQASPDGSMIAFLSDVGTGRTTVRSLWVMDVNGENRRKIADYARQPFWAPDSKTIAYLPQEFKKFNEIDYSTKGMVFHDLETGKDRPHPNSGKIHHLYNPGFSPDGKWIVATVHSGMGLGHGNLLIEADGERGDPVTMRSKLPRSIGRAIFQLSEKLGSKSSTRKTRSIMSTGVRTSSSSPSAKENPEREILPNQAPMKQPARSWVSMRTAGISSQSPSGTAGRSTCKIHLPNGFCS